MPEDLTLDKMWSRWLSTCITRATDEQLAILRAAFFAGAHSYYRVVESFDAGDEPTDHDMERMAALQIEIRDYFRLSEFTVPAGHA